MLFHEISSPTFYIWTMPGDIQLEVAVRSDRNTFRNEAQKGSRIRVSEVRQVEGRSQRKILYLISNILFWKPVRNIITIKRLAMMKHIYSPWTLTIIQDNSTNSASASEEQFLGRRLSTAAILIVANYSTIIITLFVTFVLSFFLAFSLHTVSLSSFSNDSL